MIDVYEEERDRREKTEAEARIEAKRIRELFEDVFGGDDAKEALQIMREYLQADTPSAPAANFEPNQAFYMDGHKAVFKLIDDIRTGKFNEQ